MTSFTVLLIEESPGERSRLLAALNESGQMAAQGVADVHGAVGLLKNRVPDVIILDLDPDWKLALRFLKQLMERCPLPVIVSSSLTPHGEEAVEKALHLGAQDVYLKPGPDLSPTPSGAAKLVRLALRARKSGLRFERSDELRPEMKLRADVILPPVFPRSFPKTGKLLILGASTGGTDALREVLTTLPKDAPPVAIVQHMPEKFTAAFAERLDSLCRIRVKEARNGDLLEPGLALLAPGGVHMLVQRSGNDYCVLLNDGPPVSRHRPSVDVLFRSAAQAAGPNALGVIMTGMGDDGAAGLLEMKNTGAYTIAQDEATSVVFGMPGEAIKRGGAAKVLPLGKIAAHALEKIGQQR